MASLIPAAASSPAGAPSRSKKRPASPGTGSGPAKKKKATAPGGSQVKGAERPARMRSDDHFPLPAAHARGRRARSARAPAAGRWGVPASGAVRPLPAPGRRVPAGGDCRPSLWLRRPLLPSAWLPTVPLPSSRRSRPWPGWKLPSAREGMAAGCLPLSRGASVAVGLAVSLQAFERRVFTPLLSSPCSVEAVSPPCTQLDR